eukprot:TRINITY_DN14272_c0_g1_i1.p1 TRINITY_DN14272_c0_g1~~TRINITY_DN14272_c0_g1_i1.p1  ORF type:complete len:213 (-),score=39.99 TRINITY_DN14272_c0_g1_i1:10-555(-)
MIQGGDPTGTGTGGKSVWGQPFRDEFLPSLTHNKRGVVSMANAGRNSNQSQFFISYKAAHHLDNKHTVFGRVVGKLETLDLMESMKSDGKDRPVRDIKLNKVNVIRNPFRQDELEEERKILEEETKKKEREEKDKTARGMWFSNPGGRTVGQDEKVGRYMNLESKSANKVQFGLGLPAPNK